MRKWMGWWKEEQRNERDGREMERKNDSHSKLSLQRSPFIFPPSFNIFRVFRLKKLLGMIFSWTNLSASLTRHQRSDAMARSLSASLVWKAVEITSNYHGGTREEKKRKKNRLYFR